MKPSQKSAGLLESAGNPKRRWTEGYLTPAASPRNGTEGNLRNTDGGAVEMLWFVMNYVMFEKLSR